MPFIFHKIQFRLGLRPRSAKRADDTFQIRYLVSWEEIPYFFKSLSYRTGIAMHYKDGEIGIEQAIFWSRGLHYASKALSHLTLVHLL